MSEVQATLDEITAGAKELEAVLADQDKFLRKVMKGTDYPSAKFLSHLKDLVFSVLTGTAVMAGGELAWISSLGVVGKLGLAFGLVSAPVSVTIATPFLAALGLFGALKFYRHWKSKSVDPYIPKYTDEPIHLVAHGVFQVLLPPVKVVTSLDEHVTKEEVARFRHILKEDWGYSDTYLDEHCPRPEHRSNGFLAALVELQEYAEKLAVLTAGNKSTCSNLKQEVMALVNQVVDTEKSSKREISLASLLIGLAFEGRLTDASVLAEIDAQNANVEAAPSQEPV